MNLETLKKAGIGFSYSRNGVFPQIPRVQDVLFVLQLTDKKDVKNYYSPVGAANWGTYIANLMLVAAAVASKLFYMRGFSEATAKRIVAEAILELCPPEAKCLFHDAFVEAQEIFTGQPAPSRNASRETLLATCGCSDCKNTPPREAEADYYCDCECCDNSGI